MDSIKLKTHIGDDGLLQLQLPIANQDLEVMVIYQAIPPRSHSQSAARFEQLRQQYGNQIFSDSVELLRQDRQRG
jgi:hypothetical protein